ncbi:MAG: hypothetical protein E7650_00765 [Ruminococcaceae bacterium]|nr:hypothetical protein [Oscillospiraceae bacterium]
MESFRKWAPVYLRFCRTLGLYISFLLLCFLSTSMLNTMRPAKAVLSLFIFQTLVRVFAEADRATRDIALPYREEVGTHDRSSLTIWRLILSSKPILAELLLLLLFPILLPMEVGFTAYTAPLLSAGLKRPLAKALLLLVLLPLMTGAWLLARYNAFLWWLSDKTSPDMAFGRALFLKWLGTFLIYGIGGIAFALFVPVFLSVFYIFVTLGETRWWLPPLIIIGFLFLVWLFRFLRAVRIRRRLLVRLRALCTELGATLSPIRRPYRSLLYIKQGHSFTVSINEKTYHCKLFCARNRRNPLYFSETGIVQCLHSFRFRRVEYFSYTTQVEFGFEAPAPKILIVNPVPKEIYAGNTDFSRLIDTGESVGAYKIFTATGFLGALERNVLDR